MNLGRERHEERKQQQQKYRYHKIQMRNGYSKERLESSKKNSSKMKMCN
jgi:hypothetical protein